MVPRIAVVHGRCFAGNAVLAGCADLIVATENGLARHGRPGDDRRRRARRRSRPEDVGPIAMQAPQRRGRPASSPTRRAAVAVTERAARLLPGARPNPGTAPDQPRLRTRLPRAARARLRRRPDHRDAGRRGLGHGSCASASRPSWSPRWRGSRGAPVGVIANNTQLMAGAITAARRQGRPLPAAVRRLRAAGRLAGRHARLHGRPRRRGRRARPPRLAAARRRRGADASRSIAVVLRRALRARRAGDGRRQPPRAAADGRLAGRDARADGAGGRRPAGAPATSWRRSRTPTSGRRACAPSPPQLHEHAQALNAAQLFELDDVIDPADTRATIARTLAAAGPPRPSGRTVDTW